MCGRFTLASDPATIQAAFPWVTVPTQITPRYNIAPTQPVAVIPNDPPDQLDYFVWGLIPFWAKDPSIGSRMINARSETLAEKPSFRTAYRRRRCLVIADGFYEWHKRPGERGKTPYYIRMESGEPFGIAGLWETWNSPDGSQIKSCTLITTRPNSLVEKLHNRMPVILPAQSYELWLNPDEIEPKTLNPLLEPYPAEEMYTYPVSTRVNRPANDDPEVIQPLR